VIDIVKIIAGFFLTLYALAKAFDSDEADEMQGRKNPLPLIRALLLKLENMECTQSLVQERNFGIVSPLLSPRNKSEHELDAEALKGYLGAQNKGLGNIMSLYLGLICFFRYQSTKRLGQISSNSIMQYK
jgi:hypothetical protein